MKATQLGEKAGLSRQQIHRLAKRGEIPGCELVGKQFRFDPSNKDLKRWISARRRKPAKTPDFSSMPSGELPQWMKEGPPFNISKLSKQVGDFKAIILFLDWLNACIQNTDVANLSPRAKGILKDRWLAPWVKFYNRVLKSLGEKPVQITASRTTGDAGLDDVLRSLEE